MSLSILKSTILISDKIGLLFLSWFHLKLFFLKSCLWTIDFRMENTFSNRKNELRSSLNTIWKDVRIF
jgi:hypothetical protein